MLSFRLINGNTDGSSVDIGPCKILRLVPASTAAGVLGRPLVSARVAIILADGQAIASNFPIYEGGTFRSLETPIVKVIFSDSLGINVPIELIMITESLPCDMAARLHTPAPVTAFPFLGEVAIGGLKSNGDYSILNLDSSSNLVASVKAASVLVASAKQLTAIASALTGGPAVEQKSAIVQNRGPTSIYVGPVGVTALTGIEIIDSGGVAEFSGSAILYGVCAVNQVSPADTRILESRQP